ncbi:hypothetical protein BHM03_00041804, partial [Ensete ventricosum]
FDFFITSTEGNTTHPSRVSNFGLLEQSTVFHIGAASDLSRGEICFSSFLFLIYGVADFIIYTDLAASVKQSGQTFTSNISQSGVLSNQPLASSGTTPAVRVEPLTSPQQKGQQSKLVSFSSSQLENWGESTMADASPRTDTSTDVDTDDKNQQVI